MPWYEFNGCILLGPKKQEGEWWRAEWSSIGPGEIRKNYKKIIKCGKKFFSLIFSPICQTQFQIAQLQFILQSLFH